MFTVRDFSGGINTVQDPRDIDKREFTYLSNFYVDQLGALRPSGSLISHNGLVANKNITSASALDDDIEISTLALSGSGAVTLPAGRFAGIFGGLTVCAIINI